MPALEELRHGKHLEHFTAYCEYISPGKDFQAGTTAFARHRLHISLPALKTLQDVRNQGARKILREPTESGRVLFKEAAEVLRDLVLFAKNVRRILVEHLAIAVGERNFDTHRDQSAGSTTGSGVDGNL